MTLSAGARLGPYEIESLLGAGGMGEVYRAKDTRLGRDVALKVLPERFFEHGERRARFGREAKLLAALNHPNIAAIYSFEEVPCSPGSPGRHVLVTELLEGETLREMLAEGALPVKRLLAIAAQVADGIAKAHSAGIVHRDLKPENIMVTRDGFAKILDFGLAKLAEPEAGSADRSSLPTASAGTKPGVVMGTVSYMSPEQALGKPVDFRSDQFSFGSVLYEMATGKKAFGRASGPETLTAIIREEPDSVGTLAPSMPIPLRWIVERCLAKDPEERYASTRDLARDLVRLKDGISEATSSGLGAAVVGGGRRSRLVAVAAAVLVAAAAVAFFAGRATKVQASPRFQRLVFRRGDVLAARFSPDGQTVAYSFSGGGVPSDIYSMRIGNPEFRALGLPGAQLFAISSSGEIAIGLNWEWGGNNIGAGTLARVSLAGGAARQLLKDAMDADWAPDGKNLAVLRYLGPEGTHRRIEFPLGTSLYETKDVFIGEPRVSPQGDRVAFLELEARPNGVKSIQIVDLAGTRRKLSDGWSDVHGLAWSPDGKEIWFTAAKSGVPRALHAVTLSGTERLVARLPGSLTLHDVGPGGRALLTLESTRREMHGRFSADPRERDLTWLDYSFPLDLSADGKRLLFCEAGEGSGARETLWLMKEGEANPVRLGEGSTEGSLSPDSHWVATLHVGRDGPNEIQLLPTGPGEARRIRLPDVTPLGTAWFPGGDRILVEGRNASARSQSYVVDLSGGDPHPVTPEGAEPQVISLDGKSILCDWRDRLALIPVGPGEPRSFPAKLAPGQRVLNWAGGGRTVFVGEFGLPARILRLDLETGKSSVWKEIVPSDSAGVRWVAPGLITADGKSYVYTFRRVLSDLYLVEGLK